MENDPSFILQVIHPAQYLYILFFTKTHVFELINSSFCFFLCCTEYLVECYPLFHCCMCCRSLYLMFMELPGPDCFAQWYFDSHCWEMGGFTTTCQDSHTTTVWKADARVHKSHISVYFLFNETALIYLCMILFISFSNTSPNNACSV